MGKETNIIKLLQKFKKKLEKRIRVKSLILFGSRAKGQEKENSDIDLIIVSEDFAGQKSYKRPVNFYVDWDSEYDTDIICLTPQELEKKRKEIGIIKNAMKNSIEV